MSWDLQRRPPSDLSQTVRLTNVSFEEAYPLQPHSTRHSERSGATKTVRIRFHIEAKVKGQLGLVGDVVELGCWNLTSPLLLDTRPGQFPLWTSREITLFSPSERLIISYRYVFIEGRQHQAEAEARHLDLQLRFTNNLSVTVQDQLQRPETHHVDSRQGVSLLQELSEDGSLRDQVKCLSSYIVTRGDNVTLKDLLALTHYFRHVESQHRPSESRHLQQSLLKLAGALVQVSTEEIEPVVRDILWHMAACCLPLRLLMQSITDRSAVESGRLGLGRASQLADLLGHLFNDSSEEYMARSLTLNAVRRTLRRLKPRCREEVTWFYDIWLEETQLRYIEERFSVAGSANLPAEVHKLTIILEALELSCVCSSELAALRTSLESIWQPHEESRDFLESVKGVLIDLLDTVLRWLARYSFPEALQAFPDQLGLRDTLVTIGSKYLRVLLPILWETLLCTDRLMQVDHYVPLCKGTAIGKVLEIDSLGDIPSNYSAVIAVLKREASGHSVPESVKAILLLTEQLDSKLLTYCHAHHIVLALVSSRLLPERLDLCVQVHVFDDCIEFL